MEESINSIYKSIGKYSLWFALGGVICYFVLFPDGIYYGFFCGVMAVASAVVSKGRVSSKSSTIGLILGLIDTGLALMAFYGMYLIYSSISDPVMGPKITELISKMLAQNGLTLENFVQMMGN